MSNLLDIDSHISVNHQSSRETHDISSQIVEFAEFAWDMA